ncbi:MAG: hypothetical protein F6K28_19200, partial [Microcoleus sp. SIO2G3]|nr:hypothetical protein [Microcoleus sp. SIO2G3]
MPSFGATGKITTDFGGNDYGYGVAVQSDGKIIVTGGNNSNFAIARYNSDGSLDTTFDTDGQLTTDFGGNDYGYSVAVQSDGKIVVTAESDANFVLARYNSDGSPDTTFDTDGQLTADFGGNDYGYSVAVQSDGKIVVIGESNGNFVLARYNSDGSPDTTFDTDGQLTADFGGNDYGYSVAVQSDGKIIVAGEG